MLVCLDILSARFFFAVANPSSIILISEEVLGTLIITLFLFCISNAFCITITSIQLFYALLKNGDR